MAYIIYNLLVGLLLLLALPLAPFAMLVPRVRKGLKERLGWLPLSVRASASMAERRIWIHAASVGEVNAIAPVLSELQVLLPQAGVVVTCTTAAGREHARKKIPDALAHLLMPLDASPFLKPMLQWFNPGLAIFVETELWPNFIRLLAARGCVVMMANARMSERSFKGYRLARPLFSEVLRRVHTIAAQSSADAQRYIALGAHQRKVMVAGNTKYDLQAVMEEGEKHKDSIRRELGLEEGQPLVVAGSTRDGEEKELLMAFATLGESHKRAALLLAPRHLERLEQVRAQAEKLGFSVATRKGIQQGRGAGSQVVLLDTLGELAWMYAGADVAWTGGSWRDFGGQNPLEAACHGVPVIFGPYMAHFSEAASLLLQREAALQLPDSKKLAEATSELLSSSSRRKAMAEKAAGALKERAGASRRVAQLAAKLVLIEDMKARGEDWRAESLRREATPREFGDTMEPNDF